MDALSKPKLAISACLLGHEVYHNGGHKRARFVTDLLAKFFEFIPICPEMGIGLGAPRPAMRLIGNQTEQRMVVIEDQSIDYTDDLVEYAKAQLPRIKDVSGYIFKSKSPSCGIDRVKVYATKTQIPIPEQTNGIYMRTIHEAMPLLPFEDEGRLNDAVLRENFLERVYVFHRWQQLLEQGPMSIKKLTDFHAKHKMTLMSRGSDKLYELGRLLGENKLPIEKLTQAYFNGLMTTLESKANNKSHTNVLMHLMGYLKKSLSTKEKQEMLNVIESYRQGYIPLVAPLTLMKHHFNTHPVDYIEQQYYLEPYPEELMLRNIVRG